MWQKKFLKFDDFFSEKGIFDRIFLSFLFLGKFCAKNRVVVWDVNH
jgi:hypothetical protein